MDVWSADANWKLVTPADDTNLGFAHKAIYCGDAGDIAVRKESGATPVVITVPAGALLPILVYSIDSTSTTCTNIILIG